MPLRETDSQVVKKILSHFTIGDVTEHPTLAGQRIGGLCGAMGLASPSDQGLSETSHLFSAGQRSDDLLIPQQGSSHISKHCNAVTCLTS
jgi:hypothetical protein